jgi:hypothetical protein
MTLAKTWDQIDDKAPEPEKPATQPPLANVGATSPAEAVERCRKYLEKMSDAVSGERGHDTTLQAACECYRFNLTDTEATAMMRWFNDAKCRPAWTEHELRHKLESAASKVPGSERGSRLRERRDEGIGSAWQHHDFSKLTSGATTKPNAVGGYKGTDEELIGEIRRSKSGEKFAKLYDDANLDEYEGNHRKADFALCRLLAWWTSGDADRIARIFNRSALYRDKWEEPEYQTNTITKAIAHCKGKFRKPQIILPNAITPYIETGRELGELLAKHDYYTRGDERRLARIKSENIELIEKTPAQGIFEEVAVLGMKVVDSKTKEIIVVSSRCSKDSADTILHTSTFKDALPPIKAISHCPIIDHDGTTIAGYHAPSGVYAFGEQPEEMEVEQAKPLLQGLLADFAYVTENDRARGMAAMLTPALTYSGLLGGSHRTPVACYEADRSQSGKGYAVRCTAAVYNTTPAAVSQRSGGVGSLEESLQANLIAGAPNIQIDNVRGKFDSPWFESALTEPTADCRIPYRGSIKVDPSRTVWSITSNRAEMTPDLANRCNVIRITKQEESYKYTAYSEGDLFEHIKANQTKYLGAIYAVVRAWLKAGKPGGSDGRHDMRRWAGAIRWMVQDLLGMADPLEGHRELQQRTANASSSWLRDVCLAVADAKQLDKPLQAHDLLDILIDAEVEVPGIKTHDDPDEDRVRTSGLRGIGRRLKGVFDKQDNPYDPAPVDAYEVQRKGEPHPAVPGRLVYTYSFYKSTSPQDVPNLLR